MTVSESLVAEARDLAARIMRPDLAPSRGKVAAQLVASPAFDQQWNVIPISE